MTFEITHLHASPQVVIDRVLLLERIDSCLNEVIRVIGGSAWGNCVRTLSASLGVE